MEGGKIMNEKNAVSSAIPTPPVPPIPKKPKREYNAAEMVFAWLWQCSAYLAVMGPYFFWTWIL